MIFCSKGQTRNICYNVPLYVFKKPQKNVIIIFNTIFLLLIFVIYSRDIKYERSNNGKGGFCGH